MGQKKFLTAIQRAEMVSLRNQKLMERSIAKKLRVSKSGVHQTIVKYEELGIYKNWKRSGRPETTNKPDNILMKRMVVRSPTRPMKKIRTELRRRCTVSLMTVSCCLSKEFKLISYKPANKPRLTLSMKFKH